MNTAKADELAAPTQWVRDDTEPQTIEQLLNERETRYGSFEDHARRTQALKDVLTDLDSSWVKMQPYQREALEMITHKIARVLNGDPYYTDNWVDIAGYAQLVVDILRSNEQEA